MEKKSALCKASIAFAVICAVICGIAIAPLLAAGVFAIVALICLLGCVVIYLVGLFVWLFTIGQSNIFGYASSLADFGLGLFNFVPPVAWFSFHYLTPIAGGVALGAGILGIVLASVAIARAGKRPPQEEWQTPSEEVAFPEATLEEPVANPEPAADPNPKKKKAKKKKTERRACIASIVVSSLFSALAFIALIVAFVAVTMF